MPKSTTLRNGSDERFVADSLRFSLLAFKEDTAVAEGVVGTGVLPAACWRGYPDQSAQSLSSQFHKVIVSFRTIHHHTNLEWQF